MSPGVWPGNSLSLDERGWMFPEKVLFFIQFSDKIAAEWNKWNRCIFVFPTPGVKMHMCYMCSLVLWFKSLYVRVIVPTAIASTVLQLALAARPTYASAGCCKVGS